MVNIFDHKFDNKEKVVRGLSRIYGLGKYRANLLCNKLGLGKDSRFEDLDDIRHRMLVNEVVEQGFKMNLELKREIRSCIEKKVEERSYSGLRHIYGLPVRGQRTKTNAQSAKRINNRMRG